MAQIGEQNTFIPYLIYKNFQKLLNYRHLVLDKDNKLLNEAEFIKTIQYSEYVITNCNDAKDKDRRFTPDTLATNKNRSVKTSFIILNEDSDYIKTSQKFSDLMNAVPGYKADKRDFNLEILVASRNVAGAHIEKKIKDLTSDGDQNNGYIKIYSYPYKYFTSVIPENIMVPAHRILSKDEEKKVLDAIFAKKVDLPKITKHGSIGVWLGLEIGDIVEVLLPSESTGYEIKYLTTRP
jgi:DNA-directed RNA polymerase subunit H (RpoH/RPB5)